MHIETSDFDFIIKHKVEMIKIENWARAVSMQISVC
jgi:hypothetical protein